jgi:hypothetical protein
MAAFDRPVMQDQFTTATWAVTMQNFIDLN